MKYLITILTLLLMLQTSCRRAETKRIDVTKQSHLEKNSVYYWKTIFKLDSTERVFLQENNINRIYLRMFDVVRDRSTTLPDYAAYPNATVRIDPKEVEYLNDSIKRPEIVPVVYITLEALRIMANNEQVLGNNIVTRVRNIVQYNELPNVVEMQIDCDWTQSTEQSFFKLCEEIKKSLAKLELPWKLSSTIRLHQLDKKVPPVDRGVLMVYNTGSFNNPDTYNSIIDNKEIKPYLKHLPTYKLHLDIAYPIYSWQLLFKNRTFMGLINGLNLNDTTNFVRKSERQYVAKQDIPHNGSIINKGDVVRFEKSDYSEIETVKKQIDGLLSDKFHSNIIYHLDNKNLSKYANNEIKNILFVSR